MTEVVYVNGHTLDCAYWDESNYYPCDCDADDWGPGDEWDDDDE